MSEKPTRIRSTAGKKAAAVTSEAKPPPPAKVRRSRLSKSPDALDSEAQPKVSAPKRAGSESSTNTTKRKLTKTPVAVLPEDTTIDLGELKRFLNLKHRDPHSILGAHVFDGGVIIRAFKPGAEKVEVLIGRKRPQAMAKTHSSGLFEIQVANLTEVPSYHFKVHYSDNNVFTQQDHYSFLPSVGELDLHLFAEGRHEAIYEKLGAHVRKIGKVDGVSFAVWAPQAEGVSVVGDFNSWNGALHQMRMLGGSGVWELFIPDLTPGTLYKYEIRARGWPPFLKADPYASYMEIPPNTSSIVYQSKYKFHDQTWLQKRAKREHFRQPLSIYEVHLGSWRRVLEEDNRPFQYRELARVLADYVKDLGFTSCRVSAVKGTSIWPIMGLPGWQLFCCFSTLRDARRPSLPD